MLIHTFLLMSLRTVSAQEAPPDSMQDSPVASACTIDITGSGRYLLNQAALSRGELKTAVAALPSDTAVTLRTAPETPRYMTNSVLELLERSGLNQVSMQLGTLQQEAAPEASLAPVDVPAAPAVAPGWTRVIGEGRVGLALSQLGDEDGALDARFVATRLALGTEVDMSDRLTARLLGNFIETRGDLLVPVDGPSGDEKGSVAVPRSPFGFTLRPRDAWVQIDLDEQGRFSGRAGIQVPLLGIQPWLNDQRNGFYTSSQRFHSILLLSGLQGERTFGGRLDAKLSDTVSVSAMLSNRESAFQAEDNSGKDITARTELRPVRPVRLVLSGRYGQQGEGNMGTIALADAAGRLDGERSRLMVNATYGFTETDVNAPDSRQNILSVQVAAASTIPLPMTGLDSLMLVGRGGFFDPGLEVEDGSGWMQYNLAARAVWASRDRADVHTGLGYEQYVPINLNEPISHRILMEALWAY